MKKAAKFRFIRAYGMTLVVLNSYLWLWLLGKLLGERFAAERAEAAHRRNAARLERNILALQGLFIKVGQGLSIMTNFLPPTLREGLEGLQDTVPPHPYPAIEARFRQEFGKIPGELFRDFEPTPLASASLGQVHLAHLKDGTKVAVKVQYPEIDTILRQDLKIMKRIFTLLHWIFPYYGMREVYREISQVVVRELDYQYEGRNLERIRKNFAAEPSFAFPDVFWDYSTGKILTLRFMEGMKITSVEAMKKAGLEPRRVAELLIHGYCKQIFVDGVYHADPHPGNILVRRQGGGAEARPELVLVDFGATAEISERMREGMTRFVEGLIKRDTQLLASAMRQMGFVAREESPEAFDRLVEYFYDKLRNVKIEDFRNIDISQFQHLEDVFELKKMKISFRDLMASFHVPQDWVLLERALLLTLGLTTYLAPELNPVELVLPYVEKFVLKDKSIPEVVVELTKELGLSYLRLPQEIYKTLAQVNRHGLRVEIPELARQTQRLYVLGHQKIYAFLGVAAFGFSLLFERQMTADWVRYTQYAGGFFLVLLFGSVLKNRK